MLDHGKDCCREMVKNVREASEKCKLLIPIISEERGNLIITQSIDRKTMLAKVENGPLKFLKDEKITIYAKDSVQQKDATSISINISSFVDMNIKPKYT